MGRWPAILFKPQWGAHTGGGAAGSNIKKGNGGLSGWPPAGAAARAAAAVAGRRYSNTRNAPSAGQGSSRDGLDTYSEPSLWGCWH